MCPSQRQNGLRKERMQMIVVDDFSALDHAGIGAGLRRSPPAALGCAERDEITAFAAGKGISLRSREANFTVERLVGLLFSG